MEKLQEMYSKKVSNYQPIKFIDQLFTKATSKS